MSNQFEVLFYGFGGQSVLSEDKVFSVNESVHLTHGHVWQKVLEKSRTQLFLASESSACEDEGSAIPYLSFPRALKYVHQSTGHFLFALDTQHRLQHGTQGAVVIGDILRKLLVQLHGQDVHGLEAGFEAERCIDDLPSSDPGSFGEDAGLDDRVPLLHELTPSDARDGDAHKS